MPVSPRELPNSEWYIGMTECLQALIIIYIHFERKISSMPMLFEDCKKRWFQDYGHATERLVKALKAQQKVVEWLFKAQQKVVESLFQDYRPAAERLVKALKAQQKVVEWLSKAQQKVV